MWRRRIGHASRVASVMSPIAISAVAISALAGCSGSERNSAGAAADNPSAAAAQAAPRASGRQGSAPAATPTASGKLPDCEWCGAREAPAALDWQTRIAGPDEPGEPLVIEGTVYRADGVTPAGVVMYLYHTDAKGLYSARGGETGNGRRHGALRGWLRTDDRGRYRITTIRPAPYPARTEPAHIHATVMEPGGPEYWLSSFVFADDPLVTDAYRARDDGAGSSGVVELSRDDGGTWRGTRDITLPAEPPSSAR